MSDKEFSAQAPQEPDAADRLRFEQDLPQWLAGQLTAEQSQWMQQMRARYPSLSEQSDWLTETRRVMRQEAAQEDTDLAWSLLADKLVAPQTAGPVQEKRNVRVDDKPGPSIPRWLQWLFVHPGWARVTAVATVVLVLGQAGWIASHSAPEISGAGWRSGDLDSLRGEKPPVTKVQLRLRAEGRAADMAALTQLIQSHAPDAQVTWIPQANGYWILSISPMASDELALVQQLKAQPLLEQVRLVS